MNGLKLLACGREIVFSNFDAMAAFVKYYLGLLPEHMFVNAWMAIGGPDGAIAAAKMVKACVPYIGGA